jgi:hypothetical protein
MGWNPLSRRNRDDGTEEQLRMLSRLAREDLLELGERLEDETPPTEPDAIAERATARDLTAQARPQLREAETLEAVLAVQQTICQAFVHLARSDAIVRGEEPPTRTDPCAFNPQHGPAVTEAVWSPIGGNPSTYACCHEDAELIAAGRSPRRRTVKLGVDDVPWDELGTTRRTPNDMRRADATHDYLAVALAAQRTAQGINHFNGRI